MTDKVQKIKDWISKEQDGLMDANGNFDNPGDEGAFHILTILDYYIDSLQEEPVSEDLGEYINELSKQFPEVSFAKLSRIAVRVAKWYKEKDFQYLKKECERVGSCCDEDIAIEAQRRHPYYYTSDTEAYANIGFKEGATWQKEQFEKNRLAHCDAQTEEEAEREWDFCMRILNYEHRQPTFDDAIKYGMRLKEKEMQSTIELAEDHAMLAGMEKMKEQMMEKAVEVTVHVDASNYPYIPQMELYDYDKDVPLAKDGDKYKVILIKE